MTHDIDTTIGFYVTKDDKEPIPYFWISDPTPQRFYLFSGDICVYDIEDKKWPIELIEILMRLNILKNTETFSLLPLGSDPIRNFFLAYTFSRPVQDLPLSHVSKKVISLVDDNFIDFPHKIQDVRVNGNVINPDTFLTPSISCYLSVDTQRIQNYVSFIALFPGKCLPSSSYISRFSLEFDPKLSQAHVYLNTHSFQISIAKSRWKLANEAFLKGHNFELKEAILHGAKIVGTFYLEYHDGIFSIEADNIWETISKQEVENALRAVNERSAELRRSPTQREVGSASIQ